MAFGTVTYYGKVKTTLTHPDGNKTIVFTKLASGSLSWSGPTDE